MLGLRLGLGPESGIGLRIRLVLGLGLEQGLGVGIQVGQKAGVRGPVSMTTGLLMIIP